MFGAVSAVFVHFFQRVALGQDFQSKIEVFARKSAEFYQFHALNRACKRRKAGALDRNRLKFG